MAQKSTLDGVLKAVLSIGNAEQNSAYPAFVFDSHFNIVTSFLLDKFSAAYPAGLDVILPFVEKKKIPVTNGYVQLPAEYRNRLGAPSINVRPDGKDCDAGPIIDTASEFKVAQQRAGCKTYFVEIVDKEEWDSRTTSSYKFPTYKQPIGLYEGRKIKVCPYDLSHVEIMYVKNENKYRYGYIMQPDDTYIFDESTSVESQWDDNAFKYLVRGCLALYSAYSRDNTIIEWTTILDKANLI